MQEIPALTPELAQQIERHCADFYGASEFYNRSKKIVVKEFGSAIAVRVPSRTWRNGVFCFSNDDVGYLDEIIGFYNADHEKFSFYLSPLGLTETVGQVFTKAGFIPTSNTQAVLYGTPSCSATALSSEVSVEPVASETLESYVETQVIGFEYPSDWHDGIKADIRAWFGADGFYPYLVHYRGEPAGSAYLMVCGRIGYFADDAVVPEFRRKSLHAALLNHRLVEAGRHGCDLVISAASFASASYRNHLRCGFQFAYIETTWQKSSSGGA